MIIGNAGLNKSRKRKETINPSPLAGFESPLTGRFSGFSRTFGERWFFVARGKRWGAMFGRCQAEVDGPDDRRKAGRGFSGHKYELFASAISR